MFKNKHILPNYTLPWLRLLSPLGHLPPSSALFIADFKSDGLRDTNLLTNVSQPSPGSFSARRSHCGVTSPSTPTFREEAYQDDLAQLHVTAMH